MSEGNHTNPADFGQALRAWVAKQPRVLWLILAVGLVWIIAPQIQDFVRGFLDGVSGAR